MHGLMLPREIEMVSYQIGLPGSGVLSSPEDLPVRFDARQFNGNLYLKMVDHRTHILHKHTCT